MARFFKLPIKPFIPLPPVAAVPPGAKVGIHPLPGKELPVLPEVGIHPLPTIGLVGVVDISAGNAYNTFIPPGI